MNVTVTSVHALNIQVAGMPPDAAVHRFQCEAEGCEEGPYRRPRMKLTEEWADLDIGWVEKPQLVIVTCPYPQFADRPTERARKEAYSKVVELGVETNGVTQPFGSLRPGSSVLLAPIGRWKLKAAAGTAVADVFVV